MELNSTNAEMRRFTNYILMLEHEVVEDLMNDSKLISNEEFKTFMKEYTTRAITKVIIAKLMSNLQEKRAFKKSFISDIFGWSNK